MAQRQDAVRNRERLLAAATEVFREAGAQVPLDRVATRAGVGRATLYRHFADREALITALYSRRVDALEELAAGSPDEERLSRLLQRTVELQLDAPGLYAAVHSSESGRQLLQDVAERTVALLTEAVTAAHRAGVLRPDVTVEDVLLVFAMVEGVLAAQTPDRVIDSVQRTLTLAQRGLFLAPDGTP